MSTETLAPSDKLMAYFPLTPSVKELTEHPGFTNLPLGAVPDLAVYPKPTLDRFKQQINAAERHGVMNDSIGALEHARRLTNAFKVLQLTDTVLQDPSVNYASWYPPTGMRPLLDARLEQSNTFASLQQEHMQNPTRHGILTKIQAVKFIAGLQLARQQVLSTAKLSIPGSY